MACVRLMTVIAALTCLPGLSLHTLVARQGNTHGSELQFQAGLDAFRSGRYSDAALIFGEIADGDVRGPRSTGALIMAAKAAYRAGDIVAASTRATDLLDRFPSSTYCDDALYVLALCEFRRGHYDIAVSRLTGVISDYPGSPTVDSSRKLFSEIVSSRLPLSELKRLARVRLPSGLHTIASVSLARALSRRDEDSLAVAILDGLLSDPDAARSRTDILALRDEIASGEKIGVGVLLPLMRDQPRSEVGRLASELLDGIRYALEQYNSGARPEKQLRLEVRDSGRDTAIASEVIRSMAGMGWIRAVVGPLFSDVFSAASARANSLRLPIISPTATADHLAENGPYIFQANPDYSTRGRAAARYAVEHLRMSSFAILGSDDPVGRAHAEAFRQEAERLGATVYSTVLFPAAAEDLREQFLKIRRAIMAESTLVRKADILEGSFLQEIAFAGGDTNMILEDSSGSEYVSVTRLFGPTGYSVAESLRLPISIYDTTADETDVPLMALDGIYIPLGDPGQLDYIAPQFKYFNIRAQVIGNNEWYDPDRLRDNRSYISGCLFLSDFFTDESDSATRAMTEDFRRSRGTTPTKFTLYGFDTMNLLLEQIMERIRTRNDLASALARIPVFRGLHGDIVFGGSRVNGYLHVLQYSDGVTRRLGSVQAGPR